MLFSQRRSLAKEIDEWFEENPHVEKCTDSVLARLVMLKRLTPPYVKMRPIKRP